MRKRNNNDFRFEAYRIVFSLFIFTNQLDMHTYLMMMNIFSLIDTIDLFSEHWTVIRGWKFDNWQWIDQTKTNVILHFFTSLCIWIKTEKRYTIWSTNMKAMKSDHLGENVSSYLFDSVGIVNDVRLWLFGVLMINDCKEFIFNRTVTIDLIPYGRRRKK